MTRVAILGNSGFVGTHLTSALENSGIEVRGFSSKDLDLLSPDSVSRLKEAVHPDDALVFISALTPDRGKDVATMVRNIRMGEHVCSFLSQSRCSHVVYVSSDAVYADDAHPVRESSCCDPSSFHGLMHLVRERALQATAKAANIPMVIARPAAIYGAGDTHNGYGPNRFARTAKSDGRIGLFGNGEEKRDHVHIRDVSRLLAVCVKNRTEGIINIATGKAASFLEVAEIVRGAGAGPVTIDTSARQSPITHRHFDITKLLREFPSFRFTRLADGIAELMEGAHVRS